jgi:hypothetical protein
MIRCFYHKAETVSFLRYSINIIRISNLGFPKQFIPSVFYVSVISLLHATSLTHLSFIQFNALTILHEEYQVCD